MLQIFEVAFFDLFCQFTGTVSGKSKGNILILQ